MLLDYEELRIESGSIVSVFYHTQLLRQRFEFEHNCYSCMVKVEVVKSISSFYHK